MKLPEPIAEWVRCAAHGAQHDVREIIADMQTAPVQEPVHKLIYPGGGKALFNRLWHLTCNAVATQSGMRVRTDVMPMREMKEFLDHLCVLVDSPPQPVPAPVQEPVAWWKQYPDGSISVVESRTFLAEDAVAMGWRALGFTDVAPQAQQPAPPAEVPLLTDAVRYKKLRRWMSSNVKEGWEEVERMGAVASWVGWDDFDAYLDALPECAVGLVSPPVSTEAASQKAGQK